MAGSTGVSGDGASAAAAAEDGGDVDPFRWVSVLVVVAVNLVPVYFLATDRWEPGDVLVAYWLENVVVGVFALGKIVTARGTKVVASGMTITSTRTINGRSTRSVRRADAPGSRPVLAGFFVVHFGIFTLVHGVFTALLAFSIGVSGTARGWVLMVAALVLSHGFSTWLHWVRRGERDRVSPSQAMTQPYARIVVLHVVVLGSFFLLFHGFGSSGGFLGGTSQPTSERLAPALLLIGLKTVVDVITHVRQHRSEPVTTPPTVPPG